MSISEEQIKQHQLRGQYVAAARSQFCGWDCRFGVAQFTLFGKKHWEPLELNEYPKVIEMFDNMAMYMEEEIKITKVLGKNYLKDMQRRQELNYNLEHRSEMFFDHVQ